MTEDFEQLLNDRMEQASLKELMPDFDREAEWTKVSEKLRPAGKRNIWLIWSHAAAILLGICICWLLVNENKRTMITTPVAIAPNTIKNKIPTMNDSAIRSSQIPKAANTRKTQPSVATKTRRQRSEIQKPNQIDTTAIAIHEPERKDQIPDNSNTKKQVLEIPIAAVRKTRPQALHLLDIENEDRKYMFNEGAPKQSNNMLNHMFYLLSAPDAVVTADQSFPLRSLFNKK